MSWLKQLRARRLEQKNKRQLEKLKNNCLYMGARQKYFGGATQDAKSLGSDICYQHYLIGMNPEARKPEGDKVQLYQETARKKARFFQNQLKKIGMDNLGELQRELMLAKSSESASDQLLKLHIDNIKKQKLQCEKCAKEAKVMKKELRTRKKDQFLASQKTQILKMKVETAVGNLRYFELNNDLPLTYPSEKNPFF